MPRPPPAMVEGRFGDNISLSLAGLLKASCKEEYWNDPHKLTSRAFFPNLVESLPRHASEDATSQPARLELREADLLGRRGATRSLDELHRHPAAAIDLAFNDLGDEGVVALTEGLRTRPHALKNISDVDLTANRIGDVGLAAMLQGWVCEANESSGLRRLILAGNAITLRGVAPDEFNLHRLTILSFSSNRISSSALARIFRSCSFAPRHLERLSLSNCDLGLEAAYALATWIEDSPRCRSLGVLSANANMWGTAGCERIVWALARHGGNTRLDFVEIFACRGDGNVANTPSDVQHQLLSDMIAARDVFHGAGGWRNVLRDCQVRNHALLRATRRAALGMLPVARTVLLGRPVTPVSSFGRLWRKLPGEVQQIIWNALGGLHAYPGLAPPKPPLGSYAPEQRLPMEDVPAPLTDAQLIAVLRVAGDRSTLGRNEAEILDLCGCLHFEGIFA